MKLGDRDDAKGLAVGVFAFVVLGLVFGLALGGGAALWLAAFAVGTGAANVTSFILRRRRRP